MGKNERLDGIASMRTYAMLIVFFSHCGNFFPAPGAWGGVMVSLFFVISGFLVGYKNTNNDNEKKHELVRDGIECYKKKLKHFYVLYLITLLAAIPYQVMKDISLGCLSVTSFLSKFIVHLTMLQILVPNTEFVQSFNWPAWFLSTLMVLSFFTPVVLNFCAWLRNKRIDLLFIVFTSIVIFFITIFVAPTAKAYDKWYYLLYMSPYTRIIHYTQACLVGYIYRSKCQKVLKNNKIGIIKAGIFLIYAISIYCSKDWQIAYTWGCIHVPLSLVFVFFFADSEYGAISKIFANRCVISLSKYSFEFYLIHRMILRYIGFINEKFFRFNGYLMAVICFMITVLFSVTFVKKKKCKIQ